MNREGLLWFGFGIGCVLAYKLTIYQLESFKRQCEIVPEEPKETVDKSTENALKLDTLAVLGRGVNYNLSRAAMRIVAERAVSDDIFPSLLRKIRSPNTSTRHEALKTLRFLVLGKHKSDNFYENDNDHVLSKECEAKLHAQVVFDALVRACINALPKTLPDGSVTIRDEESESYALECLRSLIHQGDLHTALEAGLVTYMKLIPTKGYPHIVAAFNDTEYQPENYFLYDIHNLMIKNKEAKGYLRRAGLYIERPKIIAGLMVPNYDETEDGHDPVQGQLDMFQRTLRERYPEARSVEEALSFATAEGASMPDGQLPAEVWT